MRGGTSSGWGRRAGGEPGRGSGVNIIRRGTVSLLATIASLRGGCHEASHDPEDVPPRAARRSRRCGGRARTCWTTADLFAVRHRHGLVAAVERGTELEGRRRYLRSLAADVGYPGAADRHDAGAGANGDPASRGDLRD